MADLNTKDSSQIVSITGADSSGAETNVVNANSDGELLTSSRLKGSAGDVITSTTNDGKVSLDVNTTGLSKVKFGNSDQLTSTGRLKTSIQNFLIALEFQYNAQPLFTVSKVTGSATANYTSTSNSVNLTVTTSSSDSAIFQTKRYFKYVAGNCYRVAIGSIPGGSTPANCTKRFGYFDTDNGMFFEVASSGISVVIRNSITGSIVNTTINQADWNMDKMDGTGSSGITLDLTKYNLFIIEFTWQGAGSVRFGMLTSQGTVFFHEAQGYNNSTTGPYTASGSLPIRAEIVNSGTLSGAETLKIFTFALSDEWLAGDTSSLNFSASRGTTSVNATGTPKPLISLRPSSTFQSQTNRITIVPRSIQILAGAQNTLVQVYLNATLTGASWASADSNSAAEVDTTATAVSGGIKVFEFYVPANSGLLEPTVAGAGGTSLQRLLLTQNVDASSRDILTVVVTSLAGGTNTFGAIVWSEEQ